MRYCCIPQEGWFGGSNWQSLSQPGDPRVLESLQGLPPRDNGSHNTRSDAPFIPATKMKSPNWKWKGSWKRSTNMESHTQVEELEAGMEKSTFSQGCKEEKDETITVPISGEKKNPRSCFFIISILVLSFVCLVFSRIKQKQQNNGQEKTLKCWCGYK